MGLRTWSLSKFYLSTWLVLCVWTVPTIFVPSNDLAFAQETSISEVEPQNAPSDQSLVTRSRNSDLRIVKNLEFAKRESASIQADLYRPATSELLPVVVMIHGGGWIAGDKWNVVDHAREMASAGFVVMSINYRLSPKHLYPAHLEDCEESLRWLKLNHNEWHANLDRIGVWGYSAGAQLAAMLAFNPNADLPVPRCCVGGGTPCDLSWIPEESRVLSTVFGGSRKENPKIYEDASPIRFVSKKSPACFLFHGTEDFLVPISGSRSMHQKLIEAGVESELFEVKGEGHLITFLNREARSKAVAFLKKKLSDPPLK